MLDPFWDSKGYVTPEAYRRFAGTTVPLARLERRVFTTAEVLSADIEVAHKGVRFAFRTRNPKRRPEAMSIRLERGPFRRFEGEWRLAALCRAESARCRQ